MEERAVEKKGGGKDEGGMKCYLVRWRHLGALVTDVASRGREPTLTMGELSSENVL